MKYTSFISHCAAAIIITGIMLCMYATVQQTYRSSANDPQIQIARDISMNETLYSLFANNHTELTQSLATFVELFDAGGTPVKSTGVINGLLPTPPKNVIIFTDAHTEDMLTWQPQPGVRLAMVFEKINGSGKGFVAVGRSLKEIEIRKGNLVRMILITWLTCMFVLLIHYFVIIFSRRKYSTQKISA